jgi:N-acetylmuramoyl-L-alanine amidase
MIYQTARLYQSTWHVGKLQVRYVAEHNCKPSKKWDPSGTHKTESAKAWPARYPGNSDAIGIELVGAFNAKTKEYETVTAEQNASLKWLIAELQVTLGLIAIEVFRHPEVSYKDATEAKTARW